MSSEDLEQLVLTIIATAGEAKRLCFNALREAIEGRVDAGRERIAEAEAVLQPLHELHLGLLSGDDLPADPKLMLLLVHAEDIFATTMSEKELIKLLLQSHAFASKPA